MLIEKIEALKGQISQLSATSEAALEELRIKYLSKKGEMAALFNEFKNVAPEQKREIGQRLNELKTMATERINTLRENFKAQEKERTRLTSPVRHSPLNWVHAIRFRLYASKSSTSSPALVSRSPTVRRWKMTGMCSAR